MTSVFSGLFTSASTVLSRRIECMRAAEADLMTMAQRFGRDKNDAATIEVINTKIPKSCIPLEKERCRLFPEQKEENFYVMHGVRVSHGEDTETSTTTTTTTAPLVLLHGYANGALYYYRNLYGLRRHFGTVYSLDMLGWGLSSRPAYAPTDGAVATSEAVFVESLEAWRAAHNIPKMVLGGHSMGGHFSVAYCERYPERVERLILISPVGVPHHQGEHTVPPEASLRWRALFGLIKTCWTHDITPGSVLRCMTEYRGRLFVRGYFDRRIPAITAEDEKTVLTEYMYLNSILPPSGEFALNKILKPVAYGRHPTVDRIPKLKVKNVAFIYGEKDWMDPSGGVEVQRRCQATVGTATATPQVEVYSVRDAGHLMLLENWEEFNAAMIIANGGTAPKTSPVPNKLTG